MTNADIVRQNTDEHLAHLIAVDWCSRLRCGALLPRCDRNCEEHILAWLKQEASEDADNRVQDGVTSND